MKLLEGADPLAEKRARKVVPAGQTFGAVADALLETLKPGFRNPKHAAQWESTLATHAAALRPKAVDAVTVTDVLEVLKPIWHETPETASRVRGRIERVLDAAKVRGLRTGENPAAWRGNLAALLPAPRKLSRGHHAAMPFAAVPAFMAELREQKGVSARALEFAILTAARSGEVMGATWGEVDEAAKLWAVPAVRMRGGREHRVPLTDRALAILAEMRPLATARDGKLDASAHVFPGAKRGRPLSVMALAMVLRRMNREGVTVHGFRSSFRDWCGEATSFPREVAEAALAPAIPNATEAAYRRGDALGKRAELMCSWNRFVSPS